ncbi:MAG: NTPase [Candidatus Aenigmarchaeota archaeon]|nr:NTPase [Candidatus Aenigmarchaeota archaeon]
MNKVIFISGPPRSGKSTVLMKVIDILKKKGLKVGGFITPEIRVRGKRIGFKVVDIHSNAEGILANVDQKTGPRLGKYRVNIPDFERVALGALDFAVNECDICVVDEIGKLEFFSEKFREKIIEILKFQKPVIAVLHRSFVDDFKGYGKIITVDLENRGKLHEKIITLIE